ncbi:gliding motility-associated C-terminal domain-containing protein [Dokdonia sp. R86516]|uniref:T9SS type B sorting domain-containing protein n=1 Tax=Dokdonia sp. R86516 TaxID=3093856 RepID=UPI0037CA2025
MGKLYLFLTLLLCSTVTAFSQCAEVETFTVCDMTVVDGNGDSIPDGIINLYEEFSAISGTTITPADGMWFDPNFNFALDVVTGDLFLWDLDNSSENITDYQFEFLNGATGCPDDVQFLFNVVLGPYSGTAASTTAGGINLQVCQGAPPFECDSTTNIDLFQTMLSNPSPHGNGEWFYVGSSPNYVGISGNRFLNVNIPYQAGPPLVDEETFELEYRVPGITPCSTEEITSVLVSVTKEPFAGFANSFAICETELLAGNFDMDINLRDDGYLVNENIEGIWLTDPTGQISGPGDSIINLREIYDDLVATTPEFGCMTYDFTYFVESRSSICSDQQSTIRFTFYEYIRPFEQNDVPELCVGDETLTTLNLYDYIDFAQEGTTLFDYPNNSCTNWRLVSGPSNLGLVSNLDEICSLVGDVDYTSAGTIDVSTLTDNTSAGTYVFEFIVNESYHCGPGITQTYIGPDGCEVVVSGDQPCESQSTQVTLIVNPINYAGEDTADLEICETESPLVLTDLLEVNDTEAPIYVGEDGVWTNTANGDVVDNNFEIPTITDSQLFNFEYTTITDNGCEDSATLSFTVYQQYDPGESGPLAVCSDAAEVDLFTLLGGTPDTNGTWSGPDGFATTDNVALFTPGASVEGEYIYSVPVNGTCAEASATVDVTLGDALYAGEDTTGVELCNTTLTVDLITLLEDNGTDTIDTSGEWTDGSGAVIVNPFTIPTITNSQTFEFIYTTGGGGCEDAATLSLTVFEQGDAGLDAAYETCQDGTTINLFTLLGGTPDTNGTWSGPSGFTTTDNEANFDPSVNAAGAYVYTLAANGACEAVTATVTVSFFATNYAGEDTTGVELCDESFTNPIDLITLLDTNGTDTIYEGTQGVWTDTATGDVVTNPFTVPAIDEQQVFSFTYTTTTDDGCGDAATLSFTVFESSDAGTGATFQVCEDGAAVDLFTILGGSPDSNGTWSGPEGYTTTSNVGSINPTTAVSGDYVYTIAANGACDAVSATISVTIVPVSNAGSDIDTFVCAGDYTTSLFGLLSDDAQLTGEFINIDTSETIVDGLIDVGALGEGTFSYLYIVFTDACGQDDATVTFTITPVMAPTVVLNEQFICINDGVTLGNLEVSVEDFVWYASAEGGDPLPLSTLLVDDTTYYVSAVNENGCESLRVPYLADVLPLSDGRCQIEISDGVSDNDDGQNDFLELGTLPDIFPNFDIQIFNRYGTIVYRGNRNTPLFDGSSNTGSGLGDQLPTGVYFYIFYPNDSNSAPIDGSFYLSR